MPTLRKILGIIVGHAIFVVSAVTLFQLTKQNPHGPASTGFQILTAVYGAAFSFLGGLALQSIARSKKPDFKLYFSYYHCWLRNILTHDS